MPSSSPTLISILISSCVTKGPTGAVRPGINTLAVEVHQATLSSTDVAFGVEVLSFAELTPFIPFRPSSESWVELFNRSASPVSLGGWRLADPIDFEFPAQTVLGAGETTLGISDRFLPRQNCLSSVYSPIRRVLA